MEIDLGVRWRPLVPLSPGLLGLALMAACSDDGLANQSSGQVATSTTGTMLDDVGDTGPNEGPGSTTGLEEGTTVAPGGSTAAGSDGLASDTATIGPELATSTGTGTGTGTQTEGTTGGSSACADGCAVEFMCGTEWPSAEDCVAWCEANLVKANEFSPFCRDAWEGVSACVATLTCEEFEQWQSPMEFPYPCSDADVVLSVECKGQ
jgi:hypothetical protein